MTEPRVDKLRTIRLLLSKAEGAATPAEAEAYTAKATELMARHGIDEALLAADAGATAEAVASLRLRTPAPYARSKADLLVRIAGGLGAEAVYHGATGTRCIAVTVFGYPTDLELINLIYASTLLQGTRAVDAVHPPWNVEVSTTTYRRSWWTGFADQIGSRLRKAREARIAEREEVEQEAADLAAETAPAGDAAEGKALVSVALVLTDRRQRIGHAVAVAFPKLHRTASASGAGGYGRGVRDGDRADLGTGQIGGSRAAIGVRA